MTGTALTRAAGVIAFLTVLSRVFGFFRETSIAAIFGATRDTDAYLMAQVLPLLFLGVVSYALTTTFIPVYSQVKAEKGREQAFRMANTVLRAIVVIGALLVLVGEIWMESLVGLVAPGFYGSELALTTYLGRIVFPIVIFQLASGIVRGMLQAEGEFAAPEASGLVQNLVIIGATLLFGSRYGIVAVAIGLLIGVFIALLIQLPALWRVGFRPINVFDLKDPGLRRMLVLIVPAIIGAGANQINTLVDRILASGLSEGKISALNYAVRLNGLAPAILGAPIITVMYPTLARFAANRDWQNFGRGLVRSLSFINFLLMPVAMVIIIFREPLVRVVYERGAFDPTASKETAWALMFLAAGLMFVSMKSLASRAFFAMQDTMTPMLIGLLTVGVNIVANLLLIETLEQGGLALGTSVAGLVGLILSLAVIARKTPSGLPLKDLLVSTLRVIIVSAISSAIVWLVYNASQPLVPGNQAVQVLLRLGLSSLIGAGVYAIFSWLLKIPELELALKFVARIFQRDKSFHTG